MAYKTARLPTEVDIADQAALDGLGIAMGPTALVADDVPAGRLVMPFPEISLPARSYFAYLPNSKDLNPSSLCFCDWLEKQGMRMSSAGL